MDSATAAARPTFRCFGPNRLVERAPPSAAATRFAVVLARVGPGSVVGGMRDGLAWAFRFHYAFRVIGMTAKRRAALPTRGERSIRDR
jgi:hypothetical protein